MSERYCCVRCKTWNDAPPKWVIGKTVWQGVRIPVFYDGLHVRLSEYELCPDCYRQLGDFLGGKAVPKAEGERCPECGAWPFLGNYCPNCGRKVVDE